MAVDLIGLVSQYVTPQMIGQAAGAAKMSPKRKAGRRQQQPAQRKDHPRAKIAGGAVSGEPALKGGAGAYSIRSWIA